MEHSKGEWEVSGNSEIIAVKDHESFAPICYIKPPNWGNARLIASAPLLYEALKHILERTDKGLPLSTAIHLTPAKQAIAKAEGG